MEPGGAEGADESTELGRHPIWFLTTRKICPKPKIIRQRWFFCKSIYSRFRNGTQKDTKTDHYTLLTNVSITRCIIRGSNYVLWGGGGEFQPDKYLTDTNSYYPSHEYLFINFIQL